MIAKLTAAFIFNTIKTHLCGRNDLWHIVNGPKRETWFSAEAIAALSSTSPGGSDGFRVYGEESHASLAQHLLDFDPSFDVQGVITAEGSRTQPDITILQNCLNDKPVVLTIIECKLISPERIIQDDDAVDMSDNCSSQLKCLLSTKNNDGLLDQLERADRFFPMSNVFGLVFVVHRTGQSRSATPKAFVDDMNKRVTQDFLNTRWQLWRDGFHLFNNLISQRSLGGMFDSEASIGLGIIERRQQSPAPVVGGGGDG